MLKTSDILFAQGLRKVAPGRIREGDGGLVM